MELEQVKKLLPESVLQIAELIGYPATQRLLELFGGTTFPVGKGLRALGATRASMLREAIGADNARLLVKHFGGEVLYLPGAIGLCVSCVIAHFCKNLPNSAIVEFRR